MMERNKMVAEVSRRGHAGTRARACGELRRRRRRPVRSSLGLAYAVLRVAGDERHRGGGGERERARTPDDVLGRLRSEKGTESYRREVAELLGMLSMQHSLQSDKQCEELFVAVMTDANVRKDHELALRVFRCMLGSLTSPSVQAYGAAIRAATNLEMDEPDGLSDERVGDSHRAYAEKVRRARRRNPLAATLCSALVNKMRTSGMAVSVSLYAIVIEACAKTSQWESALMLLGDIQKAGMPLNRAFYSSAIRACGNAGEWERALLLVLSMQQNCVGFDAVVASDMVGILWDSRLRRPSISLMRVFISRWLLDSPDMTADASLVMLDLHGLSPGAACAQVAALLMALRLRYEEGAGAPMRVLIITGKLGSVRGRSRLRMQVSSWLSSIGCTMQPSENNEGRLECTGEGVWAWLSQFESKEKMESILLRDCSG